MPDHPVQFGYCVPIFAWPGGGLFRTPNFPALDPAAALAAGRRADALGYDSLWVADHLMLGKDEAILEGWTTLAALAGSTQRAKLGIIHQGHFFRHPAVAAKMMATLDQLSGGRFIFFADTGTRSGEHRAYGLPYPEPVDARMDDFLDGLRLILALWGAGPANPLTYTSPFYHVEGAVCTPPPAQQPHPPIWFGEAHPRTFDAVARLGQGWNSVPVPIAELRRRLEALRAACATVGRDYSTIEKSLETQILIAPDRDALRAKLRAMLDLTPADAQDQISPQVRAFAAGEAEAHGLTDSTLIGTPDEIRAQVRACVEMGFTHFMLWFMDAPDPAGMSLFIEQVAPAFRA